MNPVRIQRKRTKGWRMPPGAIYVGRPTEGGNPYQTAQMTPEQAVRFFRARWQRLRHTPSGQSYLAYLRGHDLACWCALDQPFCHADVLLELANS